MSVPEDVAFKASVACGKARGEEVTHHMRSGKEYAAVKKQHARYTATLKDKTGELFMAVDSREWAESFGAKPAAPVSRAPSKQSKP